MESHPAKEKSLSASLTDRNVNGLRDLHAAQADMNAVDRTQLALNDRLRQEVLVEARMYISVGYDMSILYFSYTILMCSFKWNVYDIH